ncbi:DMT family transporter [Motiliproteus sp. MSK22-1]|uniref:DMT family transporter n=1 Tax=Motiliproteus sp. MSK22-1 TaxID=1897630 RepID=UPI001E4A0B6C|nr:DMT family transporter [Motiliproteus sp. MSK22-1]
MQSLRTAAQKQLSGEMSALATTLARYLYGLPLVVVYLIAVVAYSKSGIPALENRFLVYASGAAVAQILATVFMIQLFQRKSFAVGATFAKTEALYAAVGGALFFSQPLTAIGWAVVVVGVLGVWSMSLGRGKQPVEWKAIILGLGSGFGFAITSLWLREASLSLAVGYLLGAALTLCYMVLLQTVILTVYLLLKAPGTIQGLWQHRRIGWFIGASSALGSIGWFTAMTLQNVAYVKALGQLEFLLVVLITHRFFREKIRTHEYLGMALIAISVLVLLLA